MRLNLVHAGVVIGTVDLRREAPDGAGDPGGLLTGQLEPAPAYEALRPALQALAPALPGAAPADARAVEARRGQFAALGLELRTAAGAPVAVRYLDVVDASGYLAADPPEVRRLLTPQLPILIAVELPGRRARRGASPTAT